MFSSIIEIFSLSDNSKASILNGVSVDEPTWSSPKLSMCFAKLFSFIFLIKISKLDVIQR